MVLITLASTTQAPGTELAPSMPRLPDFWLLPKATTLPLEPKGTGEVRPWPEVTEPAGAEVGLEARARPKPACSFASWLGQKRGPGKVLGGEWERIKPVPAKSSLLTCPRGRSTTLPTRCLWEITAS